MFPGPHPRLLSHTLGSSPSLSPLPQKEVQALQPGIPDRPQNSPIASSCALGCKPNIWPFLKPSLGPFSSAQPLLRLPDRPVLLCLPARRASSNAPPPPSRISSTGPLPFSLFLPKYPERTWSRVLHFICTLLTGSQVPDLSSERQEAYIVEKSSGVASVGSMVGHPPPPFPSIFWKSLLCLPFLATPFSDC